MDRKDNKGRKLWKGEYQKLDGRYEYRFVDASGKRRSVYSWRLTKSGGWRGIIEGACKKLQG